MTTNFQLRDKLHWCDCGGRAIFLDLLSGRFFCLPKTVNNAFLRLARNEPRPGDHDQLNLMQTRGLLSETPGPQTLPSPAKVDCPTSDLIGASRVRTHMIPLLHALWTQVRLARLLRSEPFERVLSMALHVGRASPPDHPRNSAEAIAAAISGSGIILRAHNRCLIRGLCAQVLCRKKGLRTRLVFGVIDHPFSAHCWVQMGSEILVGGYEQARLYTPILVIE